MTFWQEFWHHIGVTPAQALAVIVAAAVLYLTLTTILRFWGQRLSANRSATGLAVMMVLGSVAARPMLGPQATLVGGLLVLATLLIMETIFASGRRAGILGSRRAIVIYAKGEFQTDALRRYHLNDKVVWTRLRQAGIENLDHISGLILEADGSISIVEQGKHIDPRLLQNVRNADALLN